MAWRIECIILKSKGHSENQILYLTVLPSWNKDYYYYYYYYYLGLYLFASSLSLPLTTIPADLDLKPLYIPLSLATFINQLTFRAAKTGLTIFVNILPTDAFSGKHFKGMLIRSKKSTLLQIFCELSLYIQVIFKSMRVANDTFQSTSKCEWVNNHTFCSSPGPAQGCGGLLNGTSGRFGSVDYDLDGAYEADLNCVWQIMVEENQVVKLHYENMVLETDSDCDYDYVEVGTVEISSPLFQCWTYNSCS